MSPDPSAAALEAALDALFGAPFPDFVVERKRLVGELRAAGHRAAATALGKVNRPTLASWAINQLFRRAPAQLSTMFESAARVRLGDFAATAEHRQTLARLGTLAADVLRAHGQPTSDATLRRIATSLGALSALGSFAPDAPGRLIADRDPPGFDAMALGVEDGGSAPPTLETAPARSEPAAPPPARAEEPPSASEPAAPPPMRADEPPSASELEEQAAARAVEEANAALAAAQAAAAAAAARVQLARQRAVLEELRTRQRRLANAVHDHEQAIALIQRELEERQARLRAARAEAESVAADLAQLVEKLPDA